MLVRVRLTITISSDGPKTCSKTAVSTTKARIGVFVRPIIVTALTLQLYEDMTTALVMAVLPALFASIHSIATNVYALLGTLHV